MYYETTQERRVRRKLNDYYGAHEVDSVELVDENEYRARLIDGTIAIVSVSPDGFLAVRENEPGC